MNLYRHRSDHLKLFNDSIFYDFCNWVSETGQTRPGGFNPNDLTMLLYNRFVVEDFAYHDDSIFWSVFDYFNKKVIPHKIAVFESGLKLLECVPHGAPRDEYIDNLFTHDISKFSANEAFGYFGYFGYKFGQPNSDSARRAFEMAWHHHKTHNPHHPEYWLNPNRSGVSEVLDMPEIYVVEMVADWMGAGKTYGSTLDEWLPNNIHKFKFSINTQNKLIAILDFIGIAVERYAENDFLTMKT